MGVAIIVSVVVLCMVALPIAGTWYDSRQRRRVAARRPTDQRESTPIAALRDGQPAKIRGVVVAREALVTSAISGRVCVGYRCTIDDVSHDPDLSWTPLVSREVWPAFLVTDQTGTVLVQGSMEILVDDSDGGENLSSKAYDLLAEDKVRMRDVFGERRFWFRETLLKVGDRVCVVGRPSLEIDPAGRSSSREPPRLHVMRGSASEPVVVMDDEELVGGPVSSGST